MKKVININFQGRVIPIEETAFEQLKQYIESLRRYFAQEEGRDEIINDIESRIAELFSERLKKGSVCITDEDVNSVIASMGRPEDFDADLDTAGTTSNQANSSGTGQQQQSQQTPPPGSSYATGRGRLYRNSDDKIIGGVASGLANYLGIDPVILRIVFVVFFAALFWVYILLWIIVPSRSVQSNITKRLYRSADDKVIGGVCSGLAAYFKIDTWIPRLIFALPLLIGLVSGPFNILWNDDFDLWWGPKIITGSLGSTLLFTYIILWIAVPVAVTAAEKLEMRGEEVNLNSIRDTVNEERESFKSKAEKWGDEVKESAQQFGEKAREWGQEAGSRARQFASEAGPVAGRAASGVGHVIGVLFKAFFIFIAGAIAIALFAALMSLLFGGFATLPLKDFILDGFWETVLAWSSVLLVLGIPLIALVIWLIRRIAGVRSKNSYLGWIFGGLWTIGFISAIFLMASVSRNFKNSAGVKEQVTIVQPSSSKFYVNVADDNDYYFGNSWFGIDRDEWPFYTVNADTVLLNMVRVDIAKSPDTGFHVVKLKTSHAKTVAEARENAEKINYEITQKDSLVLLPQGFGISRHEKWRNQQVRVAIYVPVGKRIELDHRISDFEWFDIRFNPRNGGYGIDYDDNRNRYHWLATGVEYIMTNDGPKRVDQLDPKELKSGRFKLKIRDKDNEVSIDVEGETGDQKENKQQNEAPPVNKDSVGGYRYRRGNNDNKQQKADTTDKRTTLNFSARLQQHS